MEMPWGPIPQDPAPQPVCRDIAVGILSNLRAGLRLSAFRPVEREDFCLGHVQASLFIALAATLLIAFHATFNLATWPAEANEYGVLVGVLVGLWLLSVVCARQHRDPQGGGSEKSGHQTIPLKTPVWCSISPTSIRERRL